MFGGKQNPTISVSVIWLFVFVFAIQTAQNAFKTTLKQEESKFADFEQSLLHFSPVQDDNLGL